ncbi:hypothetical protein B0H11DRAFT_2209951 [Mycena galericulata]|nr:hypothetical protein B0H11DRAFT_2209951 [Mycena galericulata]
MSRSVDVNGILAPSWSCSSQAHSRISSVFATSLCVPPVASSAFLVSVDAGQYGDHLMTLICEVAQDPGLRPGLTPFPLPGGVSGGSSVGSSVNDSCEDIIRATTPPGLPRSMINLGVSNASRNKSTGSSQLNGRVPRMNLGWILARARFLGPSDL